MSKQSLSYDELMSGKVAYDEIERLADARLLDDATFVRLAHIGRFSERIRNATADPDLKVSDVFTEDELQAVWRETADEGSDVGRCPLLH
jgi:hypothetical protein